MSSRYLTATAKLFAPLIAPSAPQETPHTITDPDEPANSPAHQPSTRPWELRKKHPGQSSSEAYTLTTLTCLLFFTGTLDLLLRIIPLRDLHLIWITLLSLALTPLAIAEITLISALAGDACTKFGLLQKWLPSRRTGLFFQTACITYAAWATGEPTFIHIIGYAWLGIIAFNTTSAVILNAKAAAEPTN